VASTDAAGSDALGVFLALAGSAAGDFAVGAAAGEARSASAVAAAVTFSFLEALCAAGVAFTGSTVGVLASAVAVESEADEFFDRLFTVSASM